MARQFLKDLESATQLHADHQPDSFNQRMVAYTFADRLGFAS